MSCKKVWLWGRMCLPGRTHKPRMSPEVPICFSERQAHTVYKYLVFHRCKTVLRFKKAFIKKGLFMEGPRMCKWLLHGSLRKGDLKRRESGFEARRQGREPLMTVPLDLCPRPGSAGAHGASLPTSWSPPLCRQHEGEERSTPLTKARTGRVGQHPPDAEGPRLRLTGTPSPGAARGTGSTIPIFTSGVSTLKHYNVAIGGGLGGRSATWRIPAP